MTRRQAEAALRESTRQVAKATDHYVHENPWKAIGIAAALLAGGLVMGKILIRFSLIVILGAIFAAVGFGVMSQASDSMQAIIQSIAAGALLVVVINEMIPIAVRSVKNWAGIIGAAGFVFSAGLTWAAGG